MFWTFIRERTFNFNINVFSIVQSCGDYIFAADKNSNILKILGGDVVAEFRGHTKRVKDIIINGGKLYSCSFDRTIKIWNMHSAECIKTLNYDRYFNRLLIIGDILYSYNEIEFVKWNDENPEVIFANVDDGKYKVIGEKIYAVAEGNLQIIDIATNQAETRVSFKYIDDINNIHVFENYVILIGDIMLQLNIHNSKLYPYCGQFPKKSILVGKYLFVIIAGLKIRKINLKTKKYIESNLPNGIFIDNLYYYKGRLFARANDEILMQLDINTLECIWQHRQARIYNLVFFAGDYLYALCGDKINQFNINPSLKQLWSYLYRDERMQLVFIAAILLGHCNKNIAADIIRELLPRPMIKEMPTPAIQKNDRTNALMICVAFAAASLFWYL